jgi:hypothetical protein
LAGAESRRGAALADSVKIEAQQKNEAIVAGFRRKKCIEFMKFLVLFRGLKQPHIPESRKRCVKTSFRMHKEVVSEGGWIGS